MKRFTGQTRQSELAGLAKHRVRVRVDSLHHLAETINMSLIAVSDDLHPNSDTNASSGIIPAEYTIFPETVFRRLESINVRKAPGSDSSYMTTHHCCANWFVQYLVRTSSKGSARRSWIKLTFCRFHPPMSIQSDLRPISLTPAIIKQLEATVGNWIMGYVRGKRDN